MDLKWYYNVESNGTDTAVASLYKANGCLVLQVYEGKDCYFSRPCGEYSCHIDKIKIPYEVVNKFVKEQCSDISDDEKNKAAFEFVCKLIKEDFDDQTDTILNLFS